MTFASTHRNYSAKSKEFTTSALFDPNLIKAARRIYKTYCNLHSQLSRQPSGVAINRETYRGQLVFKEKPILLPGECFIPINQIESAVY